MKKQMIDKAEQMLTELAKDGMSRPTLEVIKKKADQVYWTHNPNPKKKKYFLFEECLQGYYYILENNPSMQETFDYLKDLYDKSDDHVSSNKNRECFYVKRLVREADNHPIQKKLIREGVLHKNVLSSSSTLNQLYRRLSKFVQLYHRIHEAQQVKSELLNEQVGNLQDCINFRHLPRKQKASIYKCLGLTQQQVADSIGVNLRTIKRWWSEL